MKKLEITRATEPLEKYAREVGSEPLILTRRGKPVVAMIAIEEADLETIALGTNPKFLRLIARARAQRRRGAGRSAEETRRAVGLK